MLTYFCGKCLRPLGGPLGAACPTCRGEAVQRRDLLIAVLVGVAFGAACIAGVL